MMLFSTVQHCRPERKDLLSHRDAALWSGGRRNIYHSSLTYRRECFVRHKEMNHRPHNEQRNGWRRGCRAVAERPR